MGFRRIGRRDFLKSTAIFAGAGLITGESGAHGDWVITSSKREPYELIGFTQEEEELLDEALLIFYKRFLNHAQVEINFRAEGRDKGGVKFSEGYFEQGDELDEIPGRGVLNQQLDWLTEIALEEESEKFPKIEIYAYHAKDGEQYGKSVARAKAGIVWVKPKSVVGHFRLGINRYYLCANSQAEYTDPRYYAGVIAHEILHNLGHLHPDGDDEDYAMYHINIFEYCLVSNGNYKYGDKYTPTRCAKYPN